MKKFGQIPGIVAAVLMILPSVLYAISALSMPSQEEYIQNWEPGDQHPESVSWGRALGSFFAILYALLSAPGLAGSLLPRRKRRLGGALMLVSGILMAVVAFPWYFKFAPVMLAVAGGVARSAGDSSPEAPHPRQQDKEDTRLEE